MAPLLVVGSLVFVSFGCAVRAQHLVTGPNSYALMTGARHVDEALVRFHRTARDLCGSERYTLEEPRVLEGTERFGAATRGPDYRATLVCRI
ncbi:MAG: hypothetical protein KF729_22280 [Sandaracinaceae bacterium]|nr:hypothetical protein [Sandaracinaceae bacterium]